MPATTRVGRTLLSANCRRQNDASRKFRSPHRLSDLSHACWLSHRMPPPKGSAHAMAPHSAIPHLNSPAGSFAFGRAASASRFHRSSPHVPAVPVLRRLLRSRRHLFHRLSRSLAAPGIPVASHASPHRSRGVCGEPSTSLHTPAQGDRAPERPLRPRQQHPIQWRNAAARARARPRSIGPTPAFEINPQSFHSSPIERQPAAAHDAAASPPRDLPPALLVFRDGHSEEVRDYSIADGILYARGDYYTDGYWNKKIELSTLNVPQTLEANTQRNVKFVLPTSPNEVITRPYSSTL